MSGINLDELWIGERLLVVKSGVIGLYKGKSKDGRARLTVGRDEVLYAADELELYKEEEPDTEWMEWLDDPHPPSQRKTKPTGFSTEVDLHFTPEKNSTSLPEQVLDKQLELCRKHIENAIARKMHRIVIIHGKGEGVLRHLVHQMLDNYAEVQWKMVINQGGATEVLFYY